MTHVQTNAADGSNFLLRKRREQALNGLGAGGSLARAQDRATSERANSNIQTLVNGQTDVQLGVNRLSDQNLGGVRLGDEANETYNRQRQRSISPTRGSLLTRKGRCDLRHDENLQKCVIAEEKVQQEET